MDKPFIDYISLLFNQLAKCNFAKAKDLLKKEYSRRNSILFDEMNKISPDIINAERSYLELSFLLPRVFGKKELKENPLMSTYQKICATLLNLKEIYYRFDANVNLISEVISYIHMRRDMSLLYERLFDSGHNSKFLDLPDVLMELRCVMSNNLEPLQHVAMSAIKTAITYECNSLRNLLSAHVYLQNCQLVPCIVHMKKADENLQQWHKLFKNKDSWRISFMRSHDQSIEIYNWMLKFKKFIKQKGNLYFLMFARQYSVSNDLKALSGGNDPDIIQKFRSMSPRNGMIPTEIMLVFDASGMKDWKSPGYRCLRAYSEEERRRVDNITTHYLMVRHPENRQSLNHLPKLRDLLLNQILNVVSLDKIISYFFAEDNCTYYTAVIEERVSLVIYYHGTNAANDVDINCYVLELSSVLRAHNVLVALKPNDK